MTAESPVRVVIADDHALFRSTTRAVLAPVDGIDVVADAATASEAVAAVRAWLPDVVLMDLEMPGDGLEATRSIARAAPHVAVLVLTMHEDELSLTAALAAGACGYLVKGARRAELVRAVRGACRGQGVFGPEITRRMAALAARGFVASPAFPQLTERERQVLDEVARGLDNAAIGARLVLSAKTVRNVTATIGQKLGTRSRAELVALARDAGLGS